MEQSELINKAFYYINSFKRFRALEKVSLSEGKRDLVTYNKLKQFEMIDGLELTLRAIQKGHRELLQELSESDTDDGEESA